MVDPIPLDPRRSALVVVDMQNAFLDPSVGFRFAPAALDVVDPINRLADAVRRVGAQVVWVQTTSRPDREDWPSLRRLIGDEAMDHRTEILAPGAHGQALFPGMEVRPADATVRKYRYSAMVGPDNDELAKHLDSHDIRHLFVCGTQTNICCESTARDAMMLGYDAFLVRDCLAAETTAMHDAAVDHFSSAFGTSPSSAEVLRMLGAEEVVPATAGDRSHS